MKACLRDKQLTKTSCNICFISQFVFMLRSIDHKSQYIFRMTVQQNVHEIFTWSMNLIYKKWESSVFVLFPSKMLFVSFNSTTTGITSRAGNAYPSEVHTLTSGFLCASCFFIFSFLWYFVAHYLFVYFFCLTLCCMSFFELWILITPLASSNISFNY